MFMWIAVIAFIFAIFSGVISLSLKDDADSKKSGLHIRIHFFSGLGCVIGIVLAVAFLIAAVKYE